MTSNSAIVIAVLCLALSTSRAAPPVEAVAAVPSRWREEQRIEYQLAAPGRYVATTNRWSVRMAVLLIVSNKTKGATIQLDELVVDRAPTAAETLARIEAAAAPAAARIAGTTNVRVRAAKGIRPTPVTEAELRP